MELAIQEDIRSSKTFQTLCETDRQILERRRLDAHELIEKFVNEPESSTSLALVPVNTRQAQKARQAAQKQRQANLLAPLYTPRVSIDLAIGLQKFTGSMDSTAAFCQAGASRVLAQLAEEQGAGGPKKNQLALCQVSTSSRTEHLRSLQEAMEHELEELGISKLQDMPCDICKYAFPANRLYVITLPVKNPKKSENSSVQRCGGCWKGKLPSRSLYSILVTGKAEKFAKNVEKRMECLYGDWDERITPMVQMLKENVLRPQEIVQLLKGCATPVEFNGACAVVILTTIAFYLDYVGFRRSCDMLLALKPTATYAQLFEIFAIFFPNRAKGIKTGDFL
ncbi:hypothetical protein L5515_002333 [Caenorhabditis briggsae]|uniref:Uncharacterized protein n=1 Tax=Caenorhabditis briggsae TaxID=6238 RepID=A0AAE9E7C7_CAEBR|nr:hypothetical protein L5515_002333 [Caenorhabditis briggsae]